VKPATRRSAGQSLSNLLIAVTVFGVLLVWVILEYGVVLHELSEVRVESL